MNDYFVMRREYKTFSAMLVAGVFFLFLSAAYGDVVAVESHISGSGEVAVPADEALYLAVDAVVDLVREKNPQVLIERESIRRALERSYQQRAELLPQLSLSAEQTRQQLGRGFAGEDFDTPPFDSFGTRIEGTLSVLDTQRYADYRLALLEHAIVEKEYEVATQEILDQAILFYFTHLRDIRRVEIIEGNIERDKRLLKLAQDQFEAGVAVKIDVTRAEVRLATERRSLMEAQTAIEDSMLQLKTLLDLDLDEELRLDRSFVDNIKSPASLKHYGEMGDPVELRPEISSQKKQLEQARLARRAASWQQLPSVELFGEWGYDSEDPFEEQDKETWLVGIRASIPVFEGGRIAAEKREAAAAVRQNEYRMRTLRNRIEREYRFALIDMDSRYEQIEIASDEVNLGYEEVAQAEERYREGLADNRELIDAQQRLANAENSHLRAVYLYGLSRLAFARAIGAVEHVLE